jgi:hypothetical protein
MMFGNKWTSEYYDAMEFYYWEPQHLGKIKNPSSRYNNQFQSLEHIQNMEVSLNHMFNTFFRLSPNGFTNSLLNTTCGVATNNKFLMQGRYDVRGFSNVVQPDLLFTADNINFSIEMKIGAKSSLEQVYKYALLHWLEQQHSGVERQSVLLYIGKGGFQDLWSEKFTNIQDVIDAAIQSNIDKLKTRAEKVEGMAIDWDEVENVLSKTVIGYCNYQDFSEILNNYSNSLHSDSDCYETVAKLFDGLTEELQRRGLS